MKKQGKVLGLMLILCLFAPALVPFSVFAAGKGTGTLVITAQDTSKKQVPAQLYVDSELKGTGTVTLKKLPAKTYVVSFGDLTGYTIVSPRSKKKNVTVKAGKTMSVTATYKKSSSGNGGTNYADQFCKRIASFEGCEGYDSCYHSASTYYTMTKTEVDCANNASDCSTANSCWSTAKPK